MKTSEAIINLISSRFVNRKEILSHLHSCGFDISDREMRDHIHNMITEDGYCIQSSSSGYKLITTREELDEAVRYIDSYIIDMAERRRKLVENFEKQKSKLVQLNIFA